MNQPVQEGRVANDSPVETPSSHASLVVSAMGADDVTEIVGHPEAVPTERSNLQLN